MTRGQRALHARLWPWLSLFLLLSIAAALTRRHVVDERLTERSSP